MKGNDMLLRHPMRNKQRFGSEFNRWVYENCNHEFYFGNVDGYSVKMSTNPPVMRIWENKHHNESVSPGQMRLLREMAFLIRIGIRDGKLLTLPVEFSWFTETHCKTSGTGLLTY